MTRLKTEQRETDQARTALRTELRSVLGEASTVAREIAELLKEAAGELTDEQTTDERAALHQLFLRMAGTCGRLEVKLRSAGAILSGDQFQRLDEQLDRSQAAHEAAHTSGD